MKIKNVNPIQGRLMIFSGDILRDCVWKMARAMVDEISGEYDYNDVLAMYLTVTKNDYKIIQEKGDQR